MYQKSLLSMNLLLRNINDSIREGDGARLIECYKVALLYFKVFKHNKYAFSVLKLLCTMKLQPERAHELTWDRFVNTKGKPGRNISLDLHMEHLNKFLKELLKNLRSNLNEANADRIAKATNNIKRLIEKTEESLNIKITYTGKNKLNTISSVQNLAAQLHKNNPFDEKSKKSTYDSFANFDGYLKNKLDTTKVIEWAIKKYKDFENTINM